MRKRIGVGAGVVAVVAAIAYVQLDAIVATFLTVLVAVTALVLVVGSDWAEHPTFEQRELARARKRAAKRQRTQGARDRDRARWEAHQAKKATRENG